MRFNCRMTQRNLYLAAYDIADPTRLRHALSVTKEYATGGQKSAYEIFLTPAEKRSFLASIHTLLNPTEDRFMLVRLDPRSKVYTLGKAVKPQDPAYFYIA